MTGQQRTVGIIGGMGPAATADLIAKITAATPASRDQDHLRLLVDSNPAIPDRNLAVAGRGPSPVPAIVTSARLLERAGAELLVIACNTAHAWVEEIRSAVTVPILSMIDVTVDGVLAAGPPQRVGVMATTACLAAELYQSRFASAGVQTITLDAEKQRLLMATIDEIKASGVTPEARSRMAELAAELAGAGADVIVAGCTEIPLALTSNEQTPASIVSSTDELARATVRAARGGGVPE